jgi:hypothetical protein
MKSFYQTYTDCQNITKDSSTGTLALFKTWINACVHKVLSMSDWNFNKSYKDYTTVANQQDFEKPYNAAKIDMVRVYTGGVYYTPPEIKDDALWERINYVAVYANVPSFWHYDDETGNIEIYPAHSSASDTVRIYFTKRVRDLSVADYTTGTVTTVANDQTITGAGGATWVLKMEGRYIKITDTSNVIGDIWFEIESVVPATPTLEIKENMPIASAGASYTIAEMIPFMEGFEDIALWYALDKFYQMREMPAMAREYERAWRDSLTDMQNRDCKSTSNILVQETPVEILDPNENPWCLTIIP